MKAIIRRRIVEVQEYRESRTPNVYGGCIPVVFNCGHVSELNFTFSYRVGDELRCHQCEKAEEVK